MANIIITSCSLRACHKEQKVHTEILLDFCPWCAKIFFIRLFVRCFCFWLCDHQLLVTIPKAEKKYLGIEILVVLGPKVELFPLAFKNVITPCISICSLFYVGSNLFWEHICLLIILRLFWLLQKVFYTTTVVLSVCLWKSFNSGQFMPSGTFWTLSYLHILYVLYRWKFSSSYISQRRWYKISD